MNTINNKKILTAGTVGEVVEWYDFTIYGFFAVVIAQEFFPSTNQFVSLMQVFGVFAIGFLTRPIGAMIFGHIGDTKGRKLVLLLSVALMGVSTLIISVLPNHQSIGIAAPILLLLMRMLQGISVGGEHTGSIVYLVEVAPKNHRGLYGSFAYAGSIFGILLGSLVATVIHSMFDSDMIAQWGWRVPFFMGAIIATVGFFIRNHLPESTITKDEQKDTSPIKAIFKTHWKSVVTIITMNLVFAVGFYMVFVYLASWMTVYFQINQEESLSINTVSLLVLIISIFFAGWLSDKIGRKPLLLLGAIGLGVSGHFMFALIQGGGLLHIMFAQSVLAIFMGFYIGPLGAAMSEQFNASIRMSAVSVGYNISFAIFGGTVPLVSTWLIHQTHNDLIIAWYLSAVAILSIIAVLLIPETAKKDLPSA